MQDLDPPREPGCFPVFQVMFGMERFDSTDPRGLAATLLNMAGPAITVSRVHGRIGAVARSRAPIDMTFTIEEFSSQIFGVVDIRSDLWEGPRSRRLIDDYQGDPAPDRRYAVAQSARLRLGDGRRCDNLADRQIAELPDIVASMSAAVAA